MNWSNNGGWDERKHHSWEFDHYACVKNLSLILLELDLLDKDRLWKWSNFQPLYWKRKTVEKSSPRKFEWCETKGRWVWLDGNKNYELPKE